MGNNSIEYVVIGVYLLFLLGIGFVFKRFNSNVSDYFRGGCRGTWWLVGTSSFMAGISAYTFTGAAGVAYEAGWSVLIIYLANVAGFLVNYIWFAARFRQMRATTGPEVIRRRYNQSTEQWYSWFTLPMGILTTGMTLYSLAIFSSAIFNFSIQHVIVVLGVIVVVYSATGGNWAIMATDFIQCLIMFVMTILLTVLCLIKLGGVGGLFEQISAAGLSSDFAIINSPETFNRSFTWVWAVAMFLRVIFIQNTMKSATRYFSVKDGQEAKKAALLGMVLTLIGAAVWFVPAITARLFYSGAVESVCISKPAESAFAVTCLNLFPPGMIGLMVVAMFAASMSSMDSGLNGNSAVMIMNIYPAMKKWLGLPELSQKKMVSVSQVYTLLFGCVGIMCALMFASINGMGNFELVLLIGALFSFPMSVPLFWGILIKRTPQWAAGFSIAFGFSASLIAYFSENLFGAPMCYYEKIFFVGTVSTIAYFVTIPFAKRNSAEYNKRTDAFFATMAKPVDFEKEIGQANDLSQLKILGYFALAMGLLITLLAIPATSLVGLFCPLSVGGVIALLGLAMVIIGHRSISKS